MFNFDIKRACECSAMHNIPNTYPSLHSSEYMTSDTKSTTKSKAQLLKQLSRMYEAGISISDISKELKMDQRTIKKLLKLLGYASEI